MRVRISSIKINPGRREAEPKAVEELARSIAAVGLLNPITIDQNNTLVAGLHRLEAAKLLGWVEIECNTIGMNGLQSELAEIDENIVRTKLTKQELGDQLLRRKELYEMLHPETKAGAAQAAGMNRAIGNNVSAKLICSPYGRQGNKERQEGNGETCRSRGSRTTAADKRMSSEADAHTGSSATRWSTSINNREMDQPLRSRGGSRASR